jgi:Flp pilus assembly pilin Flp
VSGTRFDKPEEVMKHHIRNEEGQALVEYALLLSLIAIVAFASVETFGIRVFQLYSHIVSVYP